MSVHAAALASLPGCGPARLRALLDRAASAGRSPADVWADVRAGRAGVEKLDRVWRDAAAATDLERVAADLIAANVSVLLRGDDGYPRSLVEDPDPPALLFARAGAPIGALGARVDASPRVAIVGTRRCTHYGLEIARDLARQLAARGVIVISGLALGIDGAAHEGALAAGGAAAPVAVVGSGLDVVYPRRHRRLWERVAEAGVVFSEAPLGAAPDPWRFPLRNRIIAALANVVVVVESHAAGGSMHTVQSAIDRGVPVMAVPGSVRSPSSAGTNRLLADGVAPVLDVDDVLVALSLHEPGGGAGELATPHPRPDLDPRSEAILAAVDFSPTPTEEVLRRTGLGLAAAATALGHLEIAGLVRRSGGWWERLE